MRHGAHVACQGFHVKEMPAKPILKNPGHYDYDDEFGDSCYEQDGEFRGYRKVKVDPYKNHTKDTDESSSSSGSESYDEEDVYWDEDESGDFTFDDENSSASSGSSSSNDRNTNGNFSSTSDESVGSVAE